MKSSNTPGERTIGAKRGARDASMYSALTITV